MDKKRFVKTLIHLILFIFIVNYLATKFYWYSEIWYFDMPMHFLGGFWIGLLYFYLSPSENISFKVILKTLLFVILIGIGWEIFEVLVNDVIARNPFNSLDTFSDICFDLAGGGTAIFYFFKRIIMPIKEDTV